MPSETIGTLFISPHLDDVVFSCGGLVAMQAAAGARPLVLTLFAQPPDPRTAFTRVAQLLHAQWGSKPVDALWDHRIVEDSAAIARLGARTVRLQHKDAIYRDAERDSIAKLTSGTLTDADRALVDTIADEVGAACELASDVMCPFGIGLHVDHVIAYEVGRRLEIAGVSVRYYEDLPYVLTPGALEHRLAMVPRMRADVVDVTACFEVRIAAMRCYRSQLRSVFGLRDFEPVVRRHAGALVAADRFGERTFECLR